MVSSASKARSSRNGWILGAVALAALLLGLFLFLANRQKMNAPVSINAGESFFCEYSVEGEEVVLRCIIILDNPSGKYPL